MSSDSQDATRTLIRGVGATGTVFWHGLGLSSQSEKIRPGAIGDSHTGPMKRRLGGRVECSIVHAPW
eukprot:7697369-Pyramimonas_sp.AAC.1